MRHKLLALFLTPCLLIQPAAAERRLQQDRDALRATNPAQVKLGARSTKKSGKPIQLIVQYNAPISSRGVAKASVGTSLEDTVKKLGGKQEALFKTARPAVGARGAGVAATAATDQATLSPDVETRLRAVNQKYPNRAKRGVVSDVPPGNSFLTAQVVELPAGTNSNVAIATLKKVPGVTSVYQSREYKINQTYQRQSSLKEVYGIQAIQAPQVWQSTTQGEGITVAINDTGIYFKHEALAPNLWKNPGEIAGNCIDDDSNGFVDDVYGITSTEDGAVTHKFCTYQNGNATDSRTIMHPMDCHGHGSHVAGTIAAVDNGSFGLSGVAPQAKIMALKGLSDDGGGSSVGLARNIVYATDNGADVINNSWGSGALSFPDPVLADAIRYAAAAGVVNVFAAGNDAMDMALSDPANMEEVIAVGAIDSENKLARFSNFGARIDVVAPGVDINSSMPDTCSNTDEDPIFGNMPVSSSDFTTLSGTSMATPHVSGAVALLLSANPALRVDEVRAILRASADDLGVPGFDSQFGSGRVNISRAVKMATAGKPIPRLTIRSTNPSLYRDKLGRYPVLQLNGAAISGKGSRITIKDYDGKNSVTVARNSRDIRNGLLGSVNVTGRQTGRYILEVSTSTELGTFHTATMLELFSAAKILDSVVGFNNYDDWTQQPSFKGSLVGWKAAAASKEGEGEEPTHHVYRIFERGGKTGAPPRELKIPMEYKKAASSDSDGPVYPVEPMRLSLLSNAIWFSPFVAFDYLAEPFTGQASDIGVALVPSDKQPQLPTVIGKEMSWLYGVTPVIGGTGERLLTFQRDIGISTLENKVQVLRVKSPELGLFGTNDLAIEDLLRSDKGTFLVNGSLIYPPKRQDGDAVFTAREFRAPTAGRQWPASAVLYTLKGATPATKRVLVSEPGRRVEEISSDYDMSCFVSSSMTVIDDSYLGVIEHSSNLKLKIAQGVDLGACSIPQDKFVTYLSWDRDGVYLNGYDVRTGKSGKTLLSNFVFYYSFTPTGDGNLAWIENYQSGTRLVELDVTAFRASINRTPGRPTPGPTPGPFY